MNDYVPKPREIRQIAQYRRTLKALMDAHLAGKEIFVHHQVKRSFGRNGKTYHLAMLAISGKVVWRAMNVNSNDMRRVDAAEARLMLREYLHKKDGVSIKALDYAEQVDA
jgi:hypothetical protein